MLWFDREIRAEVVKPGFLMSKSEFSSLKPDSETRSVIPVYMGANELPPILNMINILF